MHIHAYEYESSTRLSKVKVSALKLRCLTRTAVEAAVAVTAAVVAAPATVAAPAIQASSATCNESPIRNRWRIRKVHSKNGDDRIPRRSHIGCVLNTAFSVPNSSTPQILDDQPYTTRRIPKIVVDLPNSKQSLSAVNFELKTTTTMSLESSTTHRSFSTEQPLYRLDRSNGQACILLQVDALITVKYRTKFGDDEEVSIYVPNDATVTGNCDNENTVTMSLKWKAFLLSWSFAKTPGGERWYVEKIELTYNSSDRHFEHIDQPNKTIRLSTGQKHSSMLFPTPVGKSYACNGETEIPLTDGKNHAKLLLRDMKLQPFKFKNNEFAAEFSCTSLSARGFRDETAPVAVGSTLAAAVLLTIAGYAAYRYFKVKKVKYDTME